MKFYQLDVFGSGPYSGNPLAVFPGADHLDAAQMQMIASEMNLSEAVFKVDPKRPDLTPANHG